MSRSKTLLDVCHEVATIAEWSAYALGKQLGPEALRKKFSDDFSECAPEAPAIAHDCRPYDDPSSARLYLEARSIERELLGRGVRKMVDEHWIAQARRPGQASPVSINPTLLLSLDIAIDATAIDLEGIEYLDLAFRPASADRFEELVQVVRDHALRMDPRVDTIADFQRQVCQILRKPVSDSNFRKALSDAGIASRWSAKGRKPGSPSHPK